MAYSLKGIFPRKQQFSYPSRLPQGIGVRASLPEWLMALPVLTNTLLQSCIKMFDNKRKKSYLLVCQESEGIYYAYAASGHGFSLKETCRKNRVLRTTDRKEALKHMVKLYNSKKARYTPGDEWHLNRETESTINRLKALDPSQVPEAKL